jgi:hypothetical protein
MLKSMADSGAASKRKEEALMALCKILVMIAGIDRDTSALKNADIEMLASRMKMDKKVIGGIIHLFTKEGNAGLDAQLKSFLDKI